MGIAMAGMLAAGLTTLPNGAWEVVFGLLTVWFGYRVVRDARSNGVRALAGGHCAPHLAHSAAMVYVFLALAAPVSDGTGMGGGTEMQTLKYPTLAFVFALILIGYTIWDLDQLSGKRYSRAGASLSPTSLSLAGVAAARVPTVGGPALAAVERGAPATAAVVADGDPAQTALTATALVQTASGGETAWLLSTGTTVGCRIAMGATMAFMLLIMI